MFNKVEKALFVLTLLVLGYITADVALGAKGGPKAVANGECVSTCPCKIGGKACNCVDCASGGCAAPKE